MRAHTEKTRVHSQYAHEISLCNVVMKTHEWTGKKLPGEDNHHLDPRDFFVTQKCWPGEENFTDDEWKEMERKWAEEEQNDWAKYWKEERRGKKLLWCLL